MKKDELEIIRYLVGVCAADPKTLCESEAHQHRAQLLAVVDQQSELLERALKAATVLRRILDAGANVAFELEQELQAHLGHP